MNILEIENDIALKWIITACNKIKPINRSEVFNTAKEIVKYINKKPYNLKLINKWKSIESRWYTSLSNQPDYSVYTDDLYISELWSCYQVYSKGYLRNLNSEKTLVGNIPIKRYLNNYGVKEIYDLGCGFGFTTAGLKAIFPTAEVYGTNIINSLQYKVAEAVGKRFNFCVNDKLSNNIKKIDLIFASEYFEHIEDPITELIEVLEKKPKHLLIANAFGARAIGHFTSYRYKNSQFDPEQIKSMFNDTMKHFGYSKIKTTLWNNRPTLWRLNE